MNAFRIKVNTAVVCFILVFSLLFVTPLFVQQVKAGSTYYVATTGDDTDAGDLANPFKTLQKALNVSAAGDTIYLRGGNYNTMYYSTTGYRITKTGTRATPFTIASYPGERAVIDGSGYTLDADFALFMMYYGSSYSNNVTLRDLTFANSSQKGIRAGGGATKAVHDLNILNCSFINMTYHAILLQTKTVSTGGHIANVSVENCTFYNIQTSYSTGEGNTFIGVKNFRFCNNTIEFCRKIHLDISGGCIYGDVYNNVFHLNDSQSGEAIYIDPYGHNNDRVSFVDIYNNMIWGERVGTYASGANAIAIGGEVSGDSVDNVSIYNNVINISCPNISTPGSILYNGIILKTNPTSDNKRDNITIKFNTVYIRQGSGYPFFTNALRENIKNVVVANNIFVTNETRLTTFQLWVTDCNITDGNIMMYNNLYNHTTKHANLGKWITTQNVSEATAVVASPLFVDMAGGDLHLNSTSPCIDTADSTYTVSTDYDGNSRPNGADYDIGAYEYIYSFTDIVIPSDSDFDYAHGVQYGSGTTASPYVICNWTIQNLTVYSTTKNFTIQNCTITYHINITKVANSSLIEINDLTMDGSDAGKHSMCWIIVRKAGTITLHNNSFVNLSHSIIGW